jgi:hypothetical protein
MNLTNHEIPNNVITYLSYGPKMKVNCGLNNKDTINFIADTETIINEIQHSKNIQNNTPTEHENFEENSNHENNNENIENTSILRQRIINIIHNHIVRNDRNMDLHDKRINNKYKETKNFIKSVNENPDVSKHIIITNSDKGNKTAIMYKTDYQEAITSMLNDLTKYRSSRLNLTNTTQNELSAILSKIVKKNQLTQSQMNSLLEKYPVPPKIYGLPKLHKVTSNNSKIVFRPITSFIKSPLYKISKYLNNILTQVEFNNNYNVRNSFEVAQKINNEILPDGYIMISLDVINLYPSIPLHLIIKSIERRWGEIQNLTDITITHFLEIIQLCYRNSYCTYDGNLYRQILGLPMGSPISCILADFVMNDLIYDTLKKFDFDIPIFHKYVDDLILSIPHDKTEEVITVFNKYSRYLQFTVEIETENKIAYLDMEIIRDSSNILRTTWYKKPIATGRIINYYSNHHIRQKTNTALGFIHRIFKLDQIHSTTKKQSIILEELIKNNYPKTLIHNLIKQYQQREINTSDTQTNTNTQIKYRAIPYVKSLSERVSKMINAYDKNIKVMFKNNYDNIYSKLKDKDHKELKTHVVYSIPCTSEGCNKQYIGLTTTSLKTRLCNHNSDIKHAISRKHSSSRPKTALVDHILKTSHNFDTSATTILNQNNNTLKLNLLEALHIQNNIENCVNFKIDTANVSKYKTLLHLFNKRRKYIEPNRH